MDTIHNRDIIRNRNWNTQSNQVDPYNPKPVYFLTNSNEFTLGNPNSIRDAGPLRNCEYKVSDVTDYARTVKWKDLVENEKKLKQKQLEVLSNGGSL